ncbi:stage III sporulation protein AH [Cytobacillus horneckiae]|uniref:SpoIIIAH-like family protein n=1 Tax=Cytobacillus horneckiae TaxID=549687 RepID=A0A2N0Z9L4_9BACI|nr:SpoIIIAH-like family protein [Cytobacillus horneckiae]NRG46750.1 SpoIIIAH-like family protein [Bacillus sp. CRN 9]MBN6888822.1 SpoIIIAH-like family protein [Cytobacillus horneckiae]MCM3179997.1 SpoIIIAH-like family protein [Cytobacillus horneckiae]MEC1155386.1 SpoIIIAH-like family protein [Cytobacillus horneckiae]MED2936562.1 SpoIIIAH-like family protein [Cytobacillus horneckiae]
MLLKKQTVWLLTMLSLVVVLSVYYVTSPDGKSDLAATDQEETTGNEEAENKDDAIISTVSGEEEFVQARLEKEVERSKMQEDLTDKVAEAEVSAEEKSKAMDQLDQLKDLANKEEMLESMIKSMDYEDVLVQADGESVKVIVKAEEASKTEANKIIKEVINELGQQAAVAVEFQVKK